MAEKTDPSSAGVDTELVSGLPHRLARRPSRDLTRGSGSGALLELAPSAIALLMRRQSECNEKEQGRTVRRQRQQRQRISFCFSAPSNSETVF